MDLATTIKRVGSLIGAAIIIIIIGILFPNGSDTNPPPVPEPTGRPVATSAPGATSQPGTSGTRNLALGNPSNAVHDATQPNNYLIERPQYALSYNRDRAIPNWVSWQLAPNDIGPAQRSNEFVSDTSLPSGWLRITTDDYTGSGYDRGHMCPSADRTATQDDNDATFIMTNIVPQAPDNNRVTWEHLESYSRSLVGKGHVLYITAGSDGAIEKLKNKLTVPAFTWKVIVVAARDGNISGITTSTPVIAVRVPNDKNAKLGDWDQYRVTVASIESVTGYKFFTNLPAATQTALKSRIDPPPTN
ncbi:MAG: DNA/RNA non-specific endonuclease [Chloroflexi bacterium]|nr:DNA/RNA non-specific endonuclease [Chloroflexota bacterium]